MKCRHAKPREPGNLVPGHFWSIIRTFFRNQTFKVINLKLCCVFVRNRFKLMSFSLFYLKHNNIYSLFSKFVQINCPDISEAKFRFPDKNNLFECLMKWSSVQATTRQRNQAKHLMDIQFRLIEFLDLEYIFEKLYEQARHGRRWQRAYRFFLRTYVCWALKSNLSLII